MFKKLKDNRGVALEMAIFMILIMYSLCTIIYIACLKEKIRDNVQNYNMSVPYAIEQVGENFYNYCLNDNAENFSYDKGDYMAITDLTDIETLKCSVYNKNSNEEILIVIVNGNTYEITKWYFYNPIQNSDIIKEQNTDIEG